MAEVKSFLKEIDMAVVQRRLDARKKNISRNDGRLSKRQLATAYRGYHGLESQYHALLQMSSEAMMTTKAKNDHVRQRHIGEMKTLVEKEKQAEGLATREIKALREDFRAQLAYQYVYKNHSFKKYDDANHKRVRPISDKPEMYEQARKSAMGCTANSTRPLGSLRQAEAYKNELKNIELPPINDGRHEKHHKVNVFGDNSYDKLKDNVNETIANQTSFPNIETAMGVEVKFRQKIGQDAQDKDSLYSAPAGGFDDKTDAGSGATGHVVAFDMGQNLMLMRKNAQERLDRHRQLPAPPPSREEARREGWRRVLPPTPTRPTSVFPGNTKNSIGMKKMLKREATDMINTWTSTTRRLEKIEKVKDLDKMRREANPLPLFDRNRPTSAIIREFESYRKYQDELVSISEQREADNPIIIRQLSPKPRPSSPVSQRRSEYSRISTPVAKRRPQADGQLKRTDSEIIPSVSRTASYKQVPDNPGELHEHAMLTAAERIELEKRLRVSAKTRNNAGETSLGNDKDVQKEERADTPTPKPRRQLPKTPDVHRDDSSAKPKKVRSNKVRILPGPMFNTAILNIDKDVTLIDSVKEANDVTLEIPDETDQGQDSDRKDTNTELNQYTPKIKRRGTPKLIMVEDKPEMDKTGFVREASASRLRERLARKMHFDYDSFSRKGPDTRKQLELRARMKRKVQQQNAQLAEEIRLKNQKDSSNMSATGDRPRSRVSFNENVMVFQTI